MWVCVSIHSLRWFKICWFIDKLLVSWLRGSNWQEKVVLVGWVGWPLSEWTHFWPLVVSMWVCVSIHSLRWFKICWFIDKLLVSWLRGSNWQEKVVLVGWVGWPLSEWTHFWPLVVSMWVCVSIHSLRWFKICWFIDKLLVSWLRGSNWQEKVVLVGWVGWPLSEWTHFWPLVVSMWVCVSIHSLRWFKICWFIDKLLVSWLRGSNWQEKVVLVGWVGWPLSEWTHFWPLVVSMWVCVSIHSLRWFKICWFIDKLLVSWLRGSNWQEKVVLVGWVGWPLSEWTHFWPLVVSMWVCVSIHSLRWFKICWFIDKLLVSWLRGSNWQEKVVLVGWVGWPLSEWTHFWPLVVSMWVCVSIHSLRWFKICWFIDKLLVSWLRGSNWQEKVVLVGWVGWPLSEWTHFWPLVVSMWVCVSIHSLRWFKICWFIDKLLVSWLRGSNWQEKVVLVGWVGWPLSEWTHFWPLVVSMWVCVSIHSLRWFKICWFIDKLLVSWLRGSNWQEKVVLVGWVGWPLSEWTHFWPLVVSMWVCVSIHSLRWFKICWFIDKLLVSWLRGSNWQEKVVLVGWVGWPLSEWTHFWPLVVSMWVCVSIHSLRWFKICWFIDKLLVSWLRGSNWQEKVVLVGWVGWPLSEWTHFWPLVVSMWVCVSIHSLRWFKICWFIDKLLVSWLRGSNWQEKVVLVGWVGWPLSEWTHFWPLVVSMWVCVSIHSLRWFKICWFIDKLLVSWLRGSNWQEKVVLVGSVGWPLSEWTHFWPLVVSMWVCVSIHSLRWFKICWFIDKLLVSWLRGSNWQEKVVLVGWVGWPLSEWTHFWPLVVSMWVCVSIHSLRWFKICWFIDKLLVSWLRGSNWQEKVVLVGWVGWPLSEWTHFWPLVVSMWVCVSIHSLRWFKICWFIDKLLVSWLRGSNWQEKVVLVGSVGWPLSEWTHFWPLVVSMWVCVSIHSLRWFKICWFIDKLLVSWLRGSNWQEKVVLVGSVGWPLSEWTHFWPLVVSMWVCVSIHSLRWFKICWFIDKLLVSWLRGSNWQEKLFWLVG
jgi:hypothetical protein